MSTNDIREPGQTENEFPSLSSGSINEKQLAGLYYSRIYSSIARLTSLQDADELEKLTFNTLHWIWKNRDLLAKEKRQGIFIYKALLKQVFRYLKKRRNKERIRLLRNVLPVAPNCYLHILLPVWGTLYSLLLKIKKSWKTY